jgi:hypothetical protein
MANQFLINPITGLICFGYVHYGKSRGEVFLPGEIRLPVGRHFGPHKGFGAKHIWAEHALEMHKSGFGSYDQVPAYVASIVKAGARLHFEGQVTRGQKLTALRSTEGIAILEFRKATDYGYWSIVTTYSRRNANGTLIGKVHERPQK